MSGKGRKSEVKKDLAKPYKPTPHERASIDAYLAGRSPSLNRVGERLAPDIGHRGYTGMRSVGPNLLDPSLTWEGEGAERRSIPTKAAQDAECE